MPSTRLTGDKPDQVKVSGRLGRLAFVDFDAPCVGPARALQSAPTIASASTIAPTKLITLVSGTATVQEITPTHTILGTGGQITLIPTGVFTTTTAGNIALASTAVVGRALIMTWDAGTGKWYPSY